MLWFSVVSISQTVNKSVLFIHHKQHRLLPYIRSLVLFSYITQMSKSSLHCFAGLYGVRNIELREKQLATRASGLSRKSLHIYFQVNLRRHVDQMPALRLNPVCFRYHW